MGKEKAALQPFCFSWAHPPGNAPHTLKTKPANILQPLLSVPSAGAQYLRLNIRGLLGSAGEGAGAQALPGLLDLLQVALHVRELGDALGLSCQLLCLLQELSKAFGVHLCCRFHPRRTETCREKRKGEIWANSCVAIRSVHTYGCTERPAKSWASRAGHHSVHPPCRGCSRST